VIDPGGEVNIRASYDQPFAGEKSRQALFSMMRQFRIRDKIKTVQAV